MGDVDDYCTQAIIDGLDILGISDHVALPDDRWLNVRMPFCDLDEYMESIVHAQIKFPELRILKSSECEYAVEYASYYRELLDGKHNCDYLIGAVHFFPHQGEWLSPFDDMDNTESLLSFAEYFIESMSSGLFLFMAHPDNFGASRLTWDAEIAAVSKDIFQAAADLKVPLEINAYGLRKAEVDTPSGKRRPYPLREFWELASDYDISVIVNSDAHRPQDVAANIEDALAIAEKNTLQVVYAEDLLGLQ
ncbi:MAG: histidinol phosphatase [Planctomycetes bacterium]|nr:histidinol phosphatase [Planctomycetota bacterium]